MLNERGKVLDVSGNRDAENRNVLVWKRHNGLNQKWRIQYISDIKPEPAKPPKVIRKNEFIVDKPFILISKMRAARVLSTKGTNLVIKNRVAGDNSQVFIFDSKSNTIVPYTNKG